MYSDIQNILVTRRDVVVAGHTKSDLICFGWSIFDNIDFVYNTRIYKA